MSYRTGSPTPQISWTLDGFPLPNNDRLMIGQYVTLSGDVVSHVNITNVKPEDGGEYSCIARSRAGQSSHSARLNIYGVPFVRSMPPISAVAGKTLQIKCPVAGWPIDKIIWEKSKFSLFGIYFYDCWVLYVSTPDNDINSFLYLFMSVLFTQ